MKLFRAIVLTPIFAVSLLALADDEGGFKAKLEGYQEVPAISSPGSGKFMAKILADGSIQYELSYKDLEGTPFMSHIHLGQKHTSGGIMVWLCGNAPDANPPVGTPACPVPSGTVSGNLTAANVLGPTGQLVTVGEFSDLVNAMKAGAAYVNIHSTKVRSGEIRGQIKGD